MTPRVRIIDLHAREDDAAFWRAKTPEERVEAVEFLRRQCLYTAGLTAMPRLARVVRLVDKRS